MSACPCNGNRNGYYVLYISLVVQTKQLTLERSPSIHADEWMQYVLGTFVSGLARMAEAPATTAASSAPNLAKVADKALESPPAP